MRYFSSCGLDSCTAAFLPFYRETNNAAGVCVLPSHLFLTTLLVCVRTSGGANPPVRPSRAFVVVRVDFVYLLSRKIALLQ